MPRTKRQGKKKGLQRDTRKHLRVTDIFTILIVVMVMQVYV